MSTVYNIASKYSKCVHHINKINTSHIYNFMYTKHYMPFEKYCANINCNLIIGELQKWYSNFHNYIVLVSTHVAVNICIVQTWPVYPGRVGLTLLNVEAGPGQFCLRDLTGLPNTMQPYYHNKQEISNFVHQLYTFEMNLVITF